MRTDDNGFCITDNGKVIEGFLGDEEKAEILFVLREPNDDHPEKFWFKEILSPSYEYANNDKGKEKRAATKYKHILGSLARATGRISTENNIEALKKCAYINLYPFSGKGSKSEEFKNTLKEFKENNTCSTLIENRLSIINKNWKFVITTWDIFDALKKYYKAENKIEKVEKYYYKNEKKEKPFRKFQNADGTIFIEFYHPAAGKTYVTEELLENFIKENGFNRQNGVD